MAVKAKALEKVGDYDLLAKVGEGAAGAVYKARHRATGQIVAIKIVNQDVAEDAVLLKRFVGKKGKKRCQDPFSRPFLKASERRRMEKRRPPTALRWPGR